MKSEKKIDKPVSLDTLRNSIKNRGVAYFKNVKMAALKVNNEISLMPSRFYKYISSDNKRARPK